jgi:hypothetical protein
MANVESIQMAKNSIILKFVEEFSNISEIKRFEIPKDIIDDTITINFSESIRTFLWLESQDTEAAEFFKACGNYPGDDYEKLKLYLETQLDTGSELWDGVTVGRSASIAHRFFDGRWMPGHFGTLKNIGRCYAGVIFNQIRLKRRGGNIYFAEIVLPIVFYYPL